MLVRFALNPQPIALEPDVRHVRDPHLVTCQLGASHSRGGKELHHVLPDRHVETWSFDLVLKCRGRDRLPDDRLNIK
jgi:hypothetical protein